MAHCRDFSLVKNLRTEGIVWQKFSARELFFHQASAILVVQGLMLQDLFPPAAYFIHTEHPRVVLCGGPFVFLRGELSPPEDPPLRLKHVVLASILEYPQDATKEQIFGHLLKAVQ